MWAATVLLCIYVCMRACVHMCVRVCMYVCMCGCACVRAPDCKLCTIPELLYVSCVVVKGHAGVLGVAGHHDGAHFARDVRPGAFEWVRE